MRLIKQGKVKDIYEVDDNTLLFHFTNRVSAFDVILPSEIPFKGEVLCRMTGFWFKILNYPNHMLELILPDKMLVKRLKIVPIEFVVRGYLYGSLYERVLRNEVQIPIEPILAAKLPEPILDPTTKFEAKDRPVTREEIVSKEWLSSYEYNMLEDVCIGIYQYMASKAEERGFILADLKLEFGRTHDGKILLADSIGPDEFRLWLKSSYSPGRKQESYDKQPVRDWLESIGYKKALEEAVKLGRPIPPPPKLPEHIVAEVSKRYIEAFEKLTGERFR
ncbi:phosphoribosylaminoimidazolesuccinocarboxamide synthase [Candidatus Bathyarchaeota archaeon]|nr:phosphoribosylaminoimidazolesuccinocarboxamide synthase [Candidatus Bathyarchaeota archaeon]MBS7612710.1 phosphoribosylaminoimidazolesuccinocarboxamide synthase [Candidatus Bathyarchaeota archaeon]MBS7617752.1 phosphoribosylaminoimidazolesuccinocarboxamide synthase [Candidatus Bathyarchaeota archaeon]